MSLFQRIAVASCSVALAGAMMAPQADAQQVPSPAEALSQAPSQLPVTGLEQLQQQIDAVRAQMPPVALPYELEPLPENDTYRWYNDPFNQFMALKAGPVLHRVSGSFFHGPDVPQAARDAAARGKVLVGPGTPIFVNDSSMCTVAVAGTDAAGRKVAITAGHCGENTGEQVKSADAFAMGNNNPVGTFAVKGDPLDYGVIELNDTAEITNEYYPGVVVNAVGTSPRPLDGACKQGVASNNTCGTVLLSDPEVSISHVCARPGDSGGPLLQGDRVVGIISGGIIPLQAAACHTPLQGPLHSPTATVSMDSVVKDLNQRGGVGAGFQPA